MTIDYLDMGCDPDDGEPFVGDAEMYERLAQEHAKLDAVPVEAIQALHHAAFASGARSRIAGELQTVGEWLDAQEHAKVQELEAKLSAYQGVQDGRTSN